MATSQNGYLVHTDQSELAILPWVTGRVLPGDVWIIFDYLCRRYHAEVEPIRKDWSWGYAYRAIRGQTSGYSNHASGTAIDLNAPKHPLGSRGTFTARQVSAIRRILDDLGGAIRWGGDYQRRPDEMHFEIDATPRRVAEVAAAIRAGKLGGIRPAPGLPGTGVNNNPRPTPAPAPDPIDPLEEIMSWYDSKEDFEAAIRALAHDGAFSAIRSNTEHLKGIVYVSSAKLAADRAPLEDAARQRAALEGVTTALRTELDARQVPDADAIAKSVAAVLVDGVDVTVTAKG